MGVQKNKTKKPAARSAEPASATPSTEAPVEAGAAVPHTQIAERAFLIWLAKGRPHGQDLENWYEAEDQLEDEDEKSQAAKA